MFKGIQNAGPRRVAIDQSGDVRSGDAALFERFFDDIEVVDGIDAFPAALGRIVADADQKSVKIGLRDHFFIEKKEGCGEQGKGGQLFHWLEI